MSLICGFIFLWTNGRDASSFGLWLVILTVSQCAIDTALKRNSTEIKKLKCVRVIEYVGFLNYVRCGK
jgi:hypothetical protein